MVKDSKNNRIGLVSGTTGGHNIVHDTNTGKSEVKVPPAPRAEPQLGLAKASPAFKKVEPKAKAEKTDEEKALAENTVKTEKVDDNTPPPVKS